MHDCQFTMTWETTLHQSILLEILSGNHTIYRLKITQLHEFRDPVVCPVITSHSGT